MLELLTLALESWFGVKYSYRVKLCFQNEIMLNMVNTTLHYFLIITSPLAFICCYGLNCVTLSQFIY